MFNPHPPLTGVPATLLLLILAAEGLSFFWKAKEARSFATILLYVLCLLAPLTYYTGYFAAEHASRGFSVPEEKIAEHQAYAKFFLISLVPCLTLSILQRSREEESRIIRALYLIFVLLSAGLCLLVSSHGGALVFDFGAGVKLIEL